jgi:hypothetical protein
VTVSGEKSRNGEMGAEASAGAWLCQDRQLVFTEGTNEEITVLTTRLSGAVPRAGILRGKHGYTLWRGALAGHE